ncbi:MAG: metal ABC transporter substrate-binding protein [Oscillospiraceae bacterium]|nr:metal ABC transporter substrate-binding protein [Oscillospiraceae bacterium]
MQKLLVLAITLLLIVGCAQIATQPVNTDTAEAEGQPLVVITSIFPQYDFVRQIAGDRVDLTMLISPGAESHSFEPTPRDMVTLNGADLFIYVYGGSEVWVYPVLASLERDDMHTLALVDLVETVDQDVVEGTEAHHHGHSHSYDDHGHSHEHDHYNDHGYHQHGNHHHDEHNYDEHHHEEHDSHNHSHGHHHHDLDKHVWTSPRNAILIVEQLTETLAALDPENAAYFRENSAAYVAQLEALDRSLAEVVAGGVRDTIVIGDRFPFRYLTDAYGLSYFAAFTGCATETQASPATIAFLIDMVNAQDIPVVFHIEFSEGLIANVIAEATGARVLELHSAHNLSPADFAAGVTYLDLMTHNLEMLREALS